MAQSKKNIATEGLSGKVGNFVFRRRKSDDKIFVSRIPVNSEEEPSEARKAVKRKFQRAEIFELISSDSIKNQLGIRNI